MSETLGSPGPTESETITGQEDTEALFGGPMDDTLGEAQAATSAAQAQNAVNAETIAEMGGPDPTDETGMFGEEGGRTSAFGATDAAKGVAEVGVEPGVTSVEESFPRRRLILVLAPSPAIRPSVPKTWIPSVPKIRWVPSPIRGLLQLRRRNLVSMRRPWRPVSRVRRPASPASRWGRKPLTPTALPRTAVERLSVDRRDRRLLQWQD